MGKAKAKTVIVTVTDEGLGNIQSVAARLRAEGMKVDQVLPMTGVITGTVPAAKKAALKAVEGVQSVEDEVQAHGPPPGPGVQ